MLDYIDCISNEDVPFEIPVTKSKEKDCAIVKENEVSSDTRRSFDDGKEKDGKTSIKGKVYNNQYLNKEYIFFKSNIEIFKMFVLTNLYCTF